MKRSEPPLYSRLHRWTDPQTLYAAHYALREPPFSIAPDPAFLYLSAHHQEALGHLLYGTGRYGGFVQLTGEVGTGKTTIVRTLLAQKLENVDIAMIHNPRQSEIEFVASICDELNVDYPRENGQPATSIKTLVDALNGHLLRTHAAGRRTVLIIDEAQNLPPGVLEQVRLLTNLETDKEKLLRIMLIGQPELTELLARPELRQLASRITARYHLTPLTMVETIRYIIHRLHVVGGAADLFTEAAMRRVHHYARGIPRQINIICDRALLGAYAKSYRTVTPAIVDQAAIEVLGAQPRTSPMAKLRQRSLFRLIPLPWVEGALAVAALIIAGVLLHQALGNKTGAPTLAIAPAAPDPVAASVAPVPATTPTIEAVTPAAATPAGPDSTTETLRASSQPLTTVMSKLIGLWQPNLTVPRGENVCRTLQQRNQLDCYRGNGSWDDLRQMNRPAILTLTLDDGTKQFALLRRLDTVNAVLDTATGPLKMPVSQLDPLWSGDLLLIWQRPVPDITIGPQSSGDAIVWLRRALARANGRSLTGPLPTNYGDDLRAQLIRFQAARGMDADGVAGSRTLIALSSLGHDSGTPTLEDAP